jgi:hypothetical protein
MNDKLKEPTTLERLQHFKPDQFEDVGKMYLCELIHNAAIDLEKAEAVIADVRKLPDKWEQDDPYANEYERARQDGKTECANELETTIKRGE